MICIFEPIHYYLQMYLKTFEINVFKYMNLILFIFYQHLDQHAKHVKKTGIESELLTDFDMLLMVEKGIR